MDGHVMMMSRTRVQRTILNTKMAGEEGEEGRKTDGKMILKKI